MKRTAEDLPNLSRLAQVCPGLPCLGVSLCIKVCAKKKNEFKEMALLRKGRRMSHTRNIMDEPIEEINVPVMKPIPYDQRRGRPPFITIRRNFNRLADEMMAYIPRPRRRRVRRRIGRLRREIRNIYQIYDRLQLNRREAPLRGFLNMYRIDGERGYDQRTFTQYIRPRVIEFLDERRKKPLKMKIVFTCKFQKGDDIICWYFHTDVKTITQDDDLREIYNLLISEILAKMDKFQNKGSGWQFEQVVSFDINVDPYAPLSGSSYIKTPNELAGKHAIINVKNERDNKCFRWAVTSAVFPRKKDPQRLNSEMRGNSEKLNWINIDFPTPLNQITRFEEQNPYSINVYEWNGKNVDRIRSSKAHAEDKQCINLILLSNGSNTHYCWIKNMSALNSSQINKYKGKRYYCRYCDHSFPSEVPLQRHEEYCSNHKAVRVKMPKKGAMLYFKNHQRKMRVPFVVYADFEAITEGISTCHPNNDESYTNQYQKHRPCGFCYYIKCTNDELFPPVLRHYTITHKDENVGRIFVEKLERDIKNIYQKFKYKKDMRITREQERDFQEAMVCHICDSQLNGDKVRDHCHLMGRYRGAAHNKCNLAYKLPKFYPVIFHNLSGYDTHMFIKDLAETPGDINCISKTEENYISFTKTINVDTFSKEGKEVKVKREIRFLDSFKFMASSLSKLAGNLTQHCNLERYFEGEKLELVKRKGVYPYDYMSSFGRLGETCLPPIECWYSKLNDEGISTEDYAHAQLVWDIFEMKTMRDYHDLYLKTDVFLLADVFEEFRDVCLKHYELDPAWYYTSPGLAWDACLKMRKVELELLHDQDILLMVEEGIRGGVSMISTRYSKANNKYMKEAKDPKDPKEGEYDPNLPSKYITYLDANNLYGWAMSKKLPTNGFKWMSPWQLENWRYHTCILEVDLVYPIDLHDLHNDYPLAPDHLEMNGVEKLIPNFYKKEKYIVHYEALKT